MNKSVTYKAITNDISVTVVSTYEPEHSRLAQEHYVFSYEVTIVNGSDLKVQLLSREWNITDLLGGEHFVQGEGVIGEQPILAQGESFTYSSWCPLQSSMGFMQGYFTFVDLSNDNTFKVKVPKFNFQPGFQKN